MRVALVAVLYSYFNPRSREGSDLQAFRPRGAGCLFQSTLPRGERLSAAWIQIRTRRISIHAPARGATLFWRAFSRRQDQFQSTLPRGERLNRIITYVVNIRISIHAPARGATSQKCRLSPDPANFNPRSREGSDCILFDHVKRINHFNPRSREGSDRV